MRFSPLDSSYMQVFTEDIKQFLLLTGFPRHLPHCFKEMMVSWK